MVSGETPHKAILQNMHSLDLDLLGPYVMSVMIVKASEVCNKLGVESCQIARENLRSTA